MLFGVLGKRRPTILYLHIPKAAGTTFARVLQQHCQNRRVFTVHRTQDAAEELASIPERDRDRLQLIKGHFAFGLHKGLRQPWEYVTILRDPIDRVISHYYYLLRTPDHYLHKQVTRKKMGLKEYVLSGWTRELDNGQVRLVSGEYARDPFRQCGRDLLEQAKEYLKQFAVVGLAERFDETVLLLCQRFGWKPPVYSRRNVTPDRPPREEFPADVIETIRSVNELDIEFYSFATELFEDALRKQDRATFQKQLTDYQRRNEAVRRA